ncbi:hypothetical protein [Streptomyces sp. NBC_00847]|uniref:VG15 protein n=1 Tax=Streptomyces sp. NBC_00847 TaxID=2975850 RepID=UPI00225E5A39|nr:hypothetical protein [Streptomyces sp. NBC_00847]MCX4886049.1 hypothetical protein [Streptomyces sp. NBC_00847]
MAVDTELHGIALDQYRRQQVITRRAAQRVQAVWRQINRRDISGSWQQLSPLLVAAVTDAQTEAAKLADPYLDDVIAAEGADTAAASRVVPGSLAGIASDGRPLLSLLYQPIIDWKVRMLSGQSMEDAFRGSLASALRITSTQVADAGRGATGVAMAGRRTIQGYVRVVQPPACSRCVILAGVEYGWNKGFQRHPRCDCIHLPTTLVARHQGRGRRGDDLGGNGFINPRSYFNELSRAEQDRVFGEAGARAIREGADMAQIVNARRGMTTMTAYGRQVLATTEGATRRGAFYRLERARTEQQTGTRFARDRIDVRRGLPRFQLRTPRLMPEEIFRLSESREDAVRMLRRFGYLT